MNLIQTVQSDVTYLWTAAVPVADLQEPVNFRVFGCTFQDGTTEKTITPDDSGIFSLPLTAEPPADANTVQHCVVHWDDDGVWQTLQEASRNIVRRIQSRIDWRVQTKGFDALPINTESGDLMVAVGQPLAASLPENMVAVKDLPTGAYSFDSALTLVHDRAEKKCYLINDIQDAENARVVRVFEGDFAHVMTRYSPINYMREVILFYTDGKIESYDSRLALTNTVNHPSPISRVVAKQKTQGSGFVILDSRGYASTYDPRLRFQSSDSSRFWVAASDSFDALIDIDGQLSIETDADLSHIFFYQFATDSPIAYGYEKTVHTTYFKYNLIDGETSTKSALPHEFILTHRNSSALSNNGGISTLGTETNVDGDLLFMALTSNPYQDEPETRSLGYFVRSVPDLKHITEPNYTSTIPDFDVDLGEVVTTTFVVSNVDPDISLPISLPAGITWEATVNGEPTKYVKAGQTVTIRMQSDGITDSPYPISIGRTSGLIEMVPDSLPDPFSWISVHDQPEDFWYETEKQTITGINVRVPLTALINTEVDYSKIKIFVNDVETEMPVYIFNNDQVHFEVWHGKFQTKVQINIGDGESSFGIYTVDELPLPQLTNWCYVPAGKTIISDELKNESPADLDLTITSGNAEFIQGGTHIKLTAGQSTQIVYTAPPNTKGLIEFKSIISEYKWHVWSHDHWLDEMPAEVRTASMTQTKSAAVEFTTVPADFKTIVRTPAGIRLYIGDNLQEEDLDSRGVNQDSHEYEIKVQDLFIEAFPRTMTHDLILGDAVVRWSLLYEEDPVPVVGRIKAPKFVRKFIERVSETVQTLDRKIVQARDAVIKFMRLRYTGLLLSAETFATGAISKALGVKRFDLNQRIELLPDVKTFKMKQTTGMQIAVKIKQKPETVLITGNISFYDPELEAAYIAPPELYRVDSNGAIYRHYSNQWSDRESLAQYVRYISYVSGLAPIPIYVKTSSYLSDRDQEARYAEHNAYFAQMAGVRYKHDKWYYVGYDRGIRVRKDTKYEVEHLPYHYVLPEYYHVDSKYDRGTWTPPYYIERVPRHIRGFNQPIIRVMLEAQVRTGVYGYRLDTGWRNIHGYVTQVKLNDSWLRFIDGSVHEVAAVTPNNVDANWNYYIGEHGGRAEYVTNGLHMLERENGAEYRQQSVTLSDHAPIPQKIDVYTVTLPELPTEPRNIPDNVFSIEKTKLRTKPAAVVTNILRKFIAENTELDVGETDPLKQGYFATELDALTDAVSKWGHDPSTVKAVERPDGSWYWVRVIPCDNNCGAYSCDTRGYLSGG